MSTISLINGNSVKYRFGLIYKFIGIDPNDHTKGWCIRGNQQPVSLPLSDLVNISIQDELDFTTQLHPDSVDLLTITFKQITLKLIKNQTKYRFTNEWKTLPWEDECRTNMMHHITKGDPTDVAIFCLFMMYRGWSTNGKSSDVYLQTVSNKLDIPGIHTPAGDIYINPND